MPDHDWILLPQLARELVDGGFSTEPVDYNRLYRGALSAEFPAEQVTSNRWGIRRGNLPKVAAALRLVQASRPSRKPAAKVAA